MQSNTTTIKPSFIKGNVLKKKKKTILKRFRWVILLHDTERCSATHKIIMVLESFSVYLLQQSASNVKMYNHLWWTYEYPTNSSILNETSTNGHSRQGWVLNVTNQLSDLRCAEQWRGVGGDVVQMSPYIKPVDHVVGISLPWHPLDKWKR